MKIGAICSTGGGAFFASVDLLLAEGLIDKRDIKLLTDRPCMATDAAKQRGISAVLHPWATETEFSRKAYEEFSGYSVVFLFFTRIVGPEITLKIPVINIHPALLPGLPGLKALTQAYQSGCKFIAATAHIATSTVDGGAILGQTVTPIPENVPLSTVESMSFLQKVYLTTCLTELINQRAITIIPERETFVTHTTLSFSSSCNPAYLSQGLKKRFSLLVQERNVQGFML